MSLLVEMCWYLVLTNVFTGKIVLVPCVNINVFTGRIALLPCVITQMDLLVELRCYLVL